MVQEVYDFLLGVAVSEIPYRTASFCSFGIMICSIARSKFTAAIQTGRLELAGRTTETAGRQINECFCLELYVDESGGVVLSGVPCPVCVHLRYCTSVCDEILRDHCPIDPRQFRVVR